MTASSQNYYQVYLNSVMTLASTIVLKSEDTASALNTYVTQVYQTTVDETDPTTWKYYLNLAGAYHSTDTVMTVTSLDTLETIDFTVANLLIHTATARSYTYGSRNYLELVARYPNQVMLILGIIYPVDMTSAINAREGLILGYPSGLVESNEYSFIAKLQDFIDGYNYRWVNKQYNTSDELYPAVSLGTLYMLMIPAIITIRQDACGTHEAHSFHVQQYLSSNGNLGDYYDYLTTEQALWLYRNIKYIQRHPGSQATFNALLENLMTSRNLPLAQYTMQHDTSTILSTLKPTITFERTALNTWATVDSKSYIDLAEMLAKEEGLARDNTNYESDYLVSAQALMANSPNATLGTKVVESAIIDYSDSNPVTLSDLLLNEWLRLSSLGIYSSYTSVTNPVTNESISLDAVDAFTFAMYCYAQTTGVTLDAVPDFIAKRVARMPLPPVSDLMSIVDASVVPTDVATLALSWMPATPTTLISTDAFYSYVNSLYTATVYQRNLYSFQEDLDRRAYVWNLIERIYCEAVCPVVSTATNYVDWMAARNIHVTDWTATDYDSVFTSLVSSATGADLTTSASLAQTQAAMIGIFKSLSSYAIQFITEINSSNIRTGDMGYVRLGKQALTIASEQAFDDITADVLDTTVVTTQEEEIDIPGTDVVQLEQSVALTQPYALPTLMQLDMVPLVFYTELHIVNVSAHPYPPLQDNSEGIVPVVGLEYYLGLTLDEQQQFKDVYSENYTPDDRQVLPHIAATSQLSGLVWHETEMALSDLTPNTQLTGLTYLQDWTESLASMLILTRSDGLVWNPTITRLGYNGLADSLSGLTWNPSDQPLSNAALVPTLTGLEYVLTPVPMGSNMLLPQLSGLSWRGGPVTDLNVMLLRKDTTGLYYEPGSVPLSGTVVNPNGTGLTYVAQSVALATLNVIPKLNGLSYQITAADLSQFVTQTRLDGLTWPSED